MTSPLDASSDSASAEQAPEPVAVLTDIHKTYKLDAVDVPVLRGIDVLIRPGLFTVVLGPSGSGKTSLLNLIGGIDRPDRGEVVVAGRRLNDLPDHELADFRSEHIGFVFQNFNLLPVLTAYENIEYPLVIAGLPPAKRHNRVVKLLHAVGLEDRARNKPGELSGGQRQRVAIARALARKPKLVIADEPTANLDSHTGAAILSLMRRMQVRYGISFIFSSHDRDLIGAADDLLFLHDGMIKKVRRKADVGPTKVAVALGALPAAESEPEAVAAPSEAETFGSWLSNTGDETTAFAAPPAAELEPAAAEPPADPTVEADGPTAPAPITVHEGMFVEEVELAEGDSHAYFPGLASDEAPLPLLDLPAADDAPASAPAPGAAPALPEVEDLHLELPPDPDLPPVARESAP